MTVAWWSTHRNRSYEGQSELVGSPDIPSSSTPEIRAGSDLEALSCFVRGRILKPGGGPWAETSVRVVERTRSDGFMPLEDQRTDSEGRLEFGAKCGVRLLLLPVQNHIVAVGDSGLTAAPKGFPEVELLWQEAARVYLRVLDESGEPLVDAWLERREKRMAVPSDGLSVPPDSELREGAFGGTVHAEGYSPAKWWVPHRFELSDGPLDVEVSLKAVLPTRVRVDSPSLGRPACVSHDDLHWCDEGAGWYDCPCGAEDSILVERTGSVGVLRPAAPGSTIEVGDPGATTRACLRLEPRLEATVDHWSVLPLVPWELASNGAIRFFFGLRCPGVSEDCCAMLPATGGRVVAYGEEILTWSVQPSHSAGVQTLLQEEAE